MRKLLISGRTKQIFCLVIKLEPGILSWLQPRKNNCVATELDVSISAIVSFQYYGWLERNHNMTLLVQ